VAIIRRIWQERDGATAAEYSLLIALIALAIIGGASALGSAIDSGIGATGSTIRAEMEARPFD
jgi:pilus assembly protein Flp/PilA